MKGRVGALLAIVFLLAGVTAAAPTSAINIKSPTETVYDDDSPGYDQGYYYVSLDLETDSNHQLLNYSIPTEEVSKSISGSTFNGSEKVHDGDHIFKASAENTNTGEVVTESVNFSVDTTAPRLSSKSPEKTIFERYPTLDIQYEDAVSTVSLSSITVWLDGAEASGNTTATRFMKELSNISEGTHNVTIELEDIYNNVLAPVSWSFTIPKKPVLSNEGPTGTVEGNDAEITLSMRDPSGIDADKSYIEVLDSDGNRIKDIELEDLENMEEKAARSDEGEQITASSTLHNLSDGVYTVNAHIKDNEGPKAEKTWEFTVDTTEPNIDLQSHADGDIVTGEQTFKVKATDDLSEINRVGVSLNGETEEVSTGIDDIYRTEIDTNEVSDGTQGLTVYGVDEAGNKATTDIDLMVDNTAPRVQDAEVYPDTLASVAEVSATVEDHATKVEHVFYTVKNTNLSGTLSPTDGSFDEAVETVVGRLNVKDLENGMYTVQVHAEDGAGHTTTQNVDITVDQTVGANLSVTPPNEMLVTAGKSETFNVRVSNTGTTGDLVSLSTTTDLDAKVKAKEKRVHAGETKSFQITVSAPKSSALGPQPLTITANGLANEYVSPTEVRVQPKPSRQTQIEHRLDALRDKFSALRDSKADYEGSVDSAEADQTFSVTEETLNQIESFITSGRYYTAAQRLDEAEEKVSSAETAVTGMVSRYERQQLISTAVKVLVGLLLIGVVIGVYMMIPPEEGYHADSGFEMREDDRHPLQIQAEEVVNRVQEKLQEVTDSAGDSGTTQSRSAKAQRPDGWSGFNNEA